MNLENYKFHKEHTWIKLSGKNKKVKVGITDYAQESLGDIIYIELPEVDSHVDADSEMAEIESTKYWSDKQYEAMLLTFARSY